MITRLNVSTCWCNYFGSFSDTLLTLFSWLGLGHTDYILSSLNKHIVWLILTVGHIEAELVCLSVVRNNLLESFLRLLTHLNWDHVESRYILINFWTVSYRTVRVNCPMLNFNVIIIFDLKTYLLIVWLIWLSHSLFNHWTNHFYFPVDLVHCACLRW